MVYKDNRVGFKFIASSVDAKGKGVLFRRLIIGLPLCLFFWLQLVACSFYSSFTSSNYKIYLPSVTQDMRLSRNSTYSDMVVLNQTSAHLLWFTNEMILSGQVLERYQKDVYDKIYTLTLVPNYQTARKEIIDAEDVEFSIKYFLTQHKNLVPALTYIQGADQCLSLSLCSLSGVKVISATKMIVTLVRPIANFMEQLSSPWFILLKKDRAHVEKVGECVLPYQTGSGLVVECKDAKISMRIGNKYFLLSELNDDADKLELQSNEFQLIGRNPTNSLAPTLSILTAFANPHSHLTKQQRISITHSIRAQGRWLANQLKLKQAYLYVPRWVSIDIPRDLLMVEKPREVVCPKQGIKILLEHSIRNLASFREGLKGVIPCNIVFKSVKPGDFFKEFEEHDFGISWFSFDFIDAYEIFSVFDCAKSRGVCYFKWMDSQLQRKMDILHENSWKGIQDRATIIDLEQQLFSKGYLVSIAEMNWWITSKKGSKSVHPAGLFRLRVEDFVL